MNNFRRRRRQDQRSSKTNESHPMTEVSFNDAYDAVRPEGGGSRPRSPSEEEPGVYLSCLQILLPLSVHRPLAPKFNILLANRKADTTIFH